MEVLEGEDDLDREEECDVVGEAAFPSKEREELTTAGIVEQHEHVRRRLERALQVDDERMIDALQNSLLRFDVVDLLEADDLALLEALESQRQLVLGLVTVLDEAHTTEGTRAESRDEVEIVQEIVAALLSLGPGLSIFRRVVCGSYSE